MKIESIWRDIEEKRFCGNCPLRDKSHPLLFRPGRDVSIMTVTEGPNEYTEPMFIASTANHPTYTFLYALFGGNFNPIGENSNVYWTHLRKCFLKTEGGKDYSKYRDKALKICSKTYLEREILSINPKLIILVGGKAVDFISKYDKRFRNKNLSTLVFNEGGIFRNVKIGKISTTIIVVPHPSGRNILWTKLPANARDIMIKISKEIIKNIK